LAVKKAGTGGKRIRTAFLGTKREGEDLSRGRREGLMKGLKNRIGGKGGGFGSHPGG